MRNIHSLGGALKRINGFKPTEAVLSEDVGEDAVLEKLGYQQGAVYSTVPSILD